MIHLNYLIFEPLLSRLASGNPREESCHQELRLGSIGWLTEASYWTKEWCTGFASYQTVGLSLQKKAQIKIVCFNPFQPVPSLRTGPPLEVTSSSDQVVAEAASARWTGGLFESGSSAHCAAPVCSLEGKSHSTETTESDGGGVSLTAFANAVR